MSEPNWTPGPWAINPDDRPDMEWNNEIVIASNPDDRICFMANPGNDDARLEEYEANARLIAAAPELYAAAAAMLAWSESPKGSILEPAAKLRAALAKARGEK